MEVRQINEEDKKKATISYYCTGHAGQNLAQCRLRIGSLIDTTKSKTVNIQRPTGKITANLQQITNVTDRGNRKVIIFGIPSSITPGITFNGEVTATSDIGGTINFVQTVLTSRQWGTSPSSTIHYLDPENTLLLDTRYPYGNPDLTKPQLVTLQPNRKDSMPTSDAPDNDFYGNWTHINDTFFMYLIYKPDSDGIYVTLRSISWKWKANAASPSWDPVDTSTVDNTDKDDIYLPRWQLSTNELIEETRNL